MVARSRLTATASRSLTPVPAQARTARPYTSTSRSKSTTERCARQPAISASRRCATSSTSPVCGGGVHQAQEQTLALLVRLAVEAVHGAGAEERQPDRGRHGAATYDELGVVE